ncbi:kinase-like protein [Neoconidiobolus thromboides FSU 785]|nr:kinase-like protein [Neoconidiobolus thromboides FSU 785]
MDKKLKAIRAAKLKASLKKVHKAKAEAKVTSDVEYDDAEDQYSSPDEEDLEDYKKGGYHPVNIGDKFNNNRYVILRKLGWGHFSTVWLTKDEKENRQVAMKVVKSAVQYSDAAKDEIKLLSKVKSANPDSEGKKYVVELLDSFVHHGPNGEHICMIFEVLGENLLGLIRRFPRGIPKNLVKKMTLQILKGLDYLHRECGIIHTDLKPENVLVCVDILPELNNNHQNSLNGNDRENPIKLSKPLTIFKDDEEDLDLDNEAEERYKNIQVKIADLGNACWVDEHFTDSIQTRQYRSPEVIVGSKWNETADIWSLACMVIELLTGDFLFEPHSGQRFDKNDDHLAQMSELLGPFPRSITHRGKYSSDFFNKKGALRKISRLRFWSLYDVLIDKYHFSLTEADLLRNFLLPMLDFSVDNRAKAYQLLDNKWLLE